MNASQDSVVLKEKQVKDLADSISKSKTLMIASIKGLPSKQFQEIKKSIREHASVRVAKKNIMLRAIKAVGKDSILELEDYIKSDCAFVISDLEGFELAGILAKKKTPVFAKAGQIAPENIKVEKGPTDLVPGPVISELGALGLQVAVENGKISIKQSKVVVKEGEIINENAASLFQKLDIKPFNVGLNISASYDIEKEKIYTEINIDFEGAANDLIEASGKALGFAQKIVYYCKETIGYFLAKANVHSEALNKLQLVEEKKEEVKEESKSKDSEEKEKEEVKESEEKPAGNEESKEENNEELKTGEVIDENDAQLNKPEDNK